MALFFYNLLLLLLSPLLAAFYAARFLQRKEDAVHWRERWGVYPGAIASDPRPLRFWVHAVSVGEVMAAAPVLRELRARHPDALLVLSVTTVGGRAVAQSQIPPADYVIYFPLDFPRVVRRALAAVRPAVLILMEWEIWNNLLAAAKHGGATVAVINGRISDTGLRRGRWFSALLAPGLGAVDVFAMQSAEDARRAETVGAAPHKITAVGNTKFDEGAAMLTADERADLRRDFGIPAGAPVWICGSTRDAPSAADVPEEAMIVEAFATVRERVPGLVLMVAPRHLERAGAVERILAGAGVGVVRRSVALAPLSPSEKLHFSGPPFPPQTGGKGLGDRGAVILLDTFGELARAYALADVAFVGGSLVPRSGQSVFQPLAQGVPAVFGAYMNNQRDIAALAQAEGVGFVVKGGGELAETVLRLLTLPAEEKATLREKCRALIERNQGVTKRTLDLVDAARGVRR